MIVGARSTSLFGLWGLVLLAFGIVAWVVTPAASTYVFVARRPRVSTHRALPDGEPRQPDVGPRRALHQVRRQRRRLLARLHRHPRRGELARRPPQPALGPDRPERLLALDAIARSPREARAAGRGARVRRGGRRSGGRRPPRQLPLRLRQVHVPHGRPGQGARQGRALQGHRAADHPHAVRRALVRGQADGDRDPRAQRGDHHQRPHQGDAHHQEGRLLRRRPRRARSREPRAARLRGDEGRAHQRELRDPQGLARDRAGRAAGVHGADRRRHREAAVRPRGHGAHDVPARGPFGALSRRGRGAARSWSACSIRGA